MSKKILIFMKKNLSNKLKEFIKLNKNQLLSFSNSLNFNLQKVNTKFEKLQEKFNLNYFKITALIKKHQKKFIMFSEKINTKSKTMDGRIKKIITTTKRKTYHLKS